MRYLKCRWCEYRTLRWRTRQDGARRHGEARLEAHAERVHPQAYAAVMDQKLAEEAMDPEELPEVWTDVDERGIDGEEDDDAQP